MKKIISIIILFIFINSAFSQDIPFQRQYLFDQTLLNPALGAKYDFVSVKLTGAEQWTNIPENPENQTLTLNMKFENSMGFNVAILNEKYGKIQNSGFKFSYFYYTKLNVYGDYISYGISASLMNLYLQLPKGEQYSTDPTLTQNSLSYFYPNAGLGVYYHHESIDLGFSAGNLLPYKPNISTLVTEPAKTRTYYFYGDTKFANEINTFAVIPSAMFSIDEKLNRQLHLSSKVVFNNAVWFGLAYKDALASGTYAMHDVMGMIGFKFFKRINFSYGYQTNIFSTRSTLGGTHSFMIGYDFINPQKRVPMYF